jgi:hypothetical protein
MVVCGDVGGAVYRVELVGIEYGPVAEQTTPTVALFHQAAPQTGADAYEAARNEWALRYYQYLQDVSAWGALPFLKRLRTKKPEEPRH